MTKKQPSAAAKLIATVKAEWGLSNRALGEMLGRSEAMIRKITRGDVPAEKYERALKEIHDNGRPTHQPARPRTKSGKLVRVRGHRGEHSVLPPDPPGRYMDLPKRGKATVARQALGPGSRKSTYMAPKTKNAKGRVAVNQQILTDLRGEAKGQARGKKRIKFEAVTSTGRIITVGEKGGYSVSAALKAVRDTGGSPLDWMSKQVQDRYSGTSGKGVTIVGWSMTSYYAKK
jgi:hypothetical protein